MILKVVILALSFSTTSAYPHRRNTREATWTDLKANQAHDLTDLTKDMGTIYKSHIESSGLYHHADRSEHPMAEEMLRKLNMESERLRARLRQELAELQERLSPSPAHLSSALEALRERLAPLTQQLQSSLSSNTQELCGQLSLYLQGLDTEDKPTSQYEGTLHWVSLTLDQSSFKEADVIGDFHSKSSGAIAHLKEMGVSSEEEEEAARLELWQDVSSRLEREVSSLSAEGRSRAEALKAEMAALLNTARPRKAEVKASLERFCQTAGLQSQVFEARMEKMFQGLEEELEVKRASSMSLSSSSSSLSIQPGGSLREEFSVKLSALIQDILHSV